MAYLSLEEQVYSLVRDQLWNQSQQWKEAFYADLVRTVHPHPGWTWEQEGWDVYEGVAAATTYGDAHLESNIKLALVAEMLGQGPREYCVIDTGSQILRIDYIEF